MRSAFISVIGEHHPRRLSNFATIVFVIKASFSCVETPCSATVSSAWLLACAAFVEGVSCFIFFLHAHYISTAWVLRLLFLSHTHCLSTAWVSCLLFLPHTHYLSIAWVLRLLFLAHTHYNYLVTNHLRIRARKSSQKISVAFVDGVGWYICAFYCAISQKKGAELMLDSLKFKSIR